MLWDKQDDAGRKLRLVELEGPDGEKAVVRRASFEATLHEMMHFIRSKSRPVPLALKQASILLFNLKEIMFATLMGKCSFCTVEG